MGLSHEVKIDFSRPGKPTDNAFVQSLNGTLRAECLDAHWFHDLYEAGQQIESWRVESGNGRSHISNGLLSGGQVKHVALGSKLNRARR